VSARTAEQRADLVRWLSCGTIVVAAHLGLAAAIVQWTDPIEAAEPSAAIVVALAPLPVAPTPLTEDIPPGPDQVQAEATPDKPVELAKQETPPEQLKAEPFPELQLRPAPDPEVAVAPPPPEVKPEPARPEESTPAPATSAPQAPQLAIAAVPAAPSQGTPKASDSTAIPTWRSQIAAALERNKRYPSQARARRQQGVAQLAFTLDRKGHVIASRIVRGSGHAALDQETLQLLRRSQPFPPPPPELPGERIELTVPVRFNLR
jgi:protein TonB